LTGKNNHNWRGGDTPAVPFAVAARRAKILDFKLAIALPVSRYSKHWAENPFSLVLTGKTRVHLQETTGKLIAFAKAG
jgi:hypothetical protein